MLAFSIDYYGMIFRATQSVELFCAYIVGFYFILMTKQLDVIIFIVTAFCFLILWKSGREQKLRTIIIFEIIINILVVTISKNNIEQLVNLYYWNLGMIVTAIAYVAKNGVRYYDENGKIKM